ncbi:MAG: ribonuclease H family protein [Clostridium sp.]|nr:ribonuclease H family protein [Clostridium sp.]
MKFYAIKYGFDSLNKNVIENKIVNTWPQCETLVKGVKGAKYKSFTSLSGAEEYLKDDGRILKPSSYEFEKDLHYAYVDGSFNSSSYEYGYAFVVVYNSVVEYIENGSGKYDSKNSIRQIAGELKAAVKAAEYAKEQRLDELIIVHDYVGVCYHATGQWERKDESSKKYYKHINEIINSTKLKLKFLKVNSHTGDLFNEVVDEFAKSAAHVNIKGETEKILKSKKIIVKNENLKNKFSEILTEGIKQEDILIEK